MTLSILIADDERAARHGMRRALARLDCQITEAEDGAEALAAIRREAPDLVFLDLNMPAMDGESVLRALEQEPHGGEIVVVTANDSLDAAVACMRLGAADYLTKPFEVERLRAIARRNTRRIALQRQVDNLQSRLDEKHACGALLGVSRPMRELFDLIQRAARAPLDILIRGETGTGKELIARELHRLSERAAGPFIAVNTVAINESLAESQLFGHDKGAFTGADAKHRGVFEQASGGTLFLDEIGDMPLPLQAKILRALQERNVQPVGSTRSIEVDVRIVSATHQDLARTINEGRFREDLYYRIKGIELSAPPLRERREDIAMLADFFLERLASHDGAPARRLSPAAMQQLLAYHWPGNVRELQQIVTAAGAMATGAVIQAAELHVPAAEPNADPFDFAALAGLPLSEAKNKLVERFERSAIEAALAENRFNVSAAARQLGIHRQSLQQKIAQLGIAKNADRGTEKSPSTKSAC